MKTRNHTHFSFSALAGLALAVTSANAATVLVDLGRTSEANLQTGWLAWNSEGGSLGPTNFTYADTTGGSLSASLSGGISSRNYGVANVVQTPVALSNPNMWSDQYFFNDPDGSITLTLGNLKAGDYQFSSYHYADTLNKDEAQFHQGVADVSINTVDTGAKATFLSGRERPGGGNNPLVSRNLTATQVMTDGTFTTTFTVATDGDAVSILYDNLTGNGLGQAFGLNGFEVSAVPEPSSAVLLGSLFTLSLITLRRR